ncbi:hypothetical protein PoB_003894800 [Plakobranchus ocellatus]|uniref:Uncharacterized protein n=1 Tax=Plakobranchus ocellatus TaxID=259542 RepID=A0AAV4AYP1_9GAST|nr:hypothetical protein PoB_003894800 [Plakobranchus ocellatus]
MTNNQFHGKTNGNTCFPVYDQLREAGTVLLNYTKNSTTVIHFRSMPLTLITDIGPNYLSHEAGLVLGFLYIDSPQQSDLMLSGPSSGQGAGSRARTCDRRVPADLKADSLATVPPKPRQKAVALVGHWAI